MPPDTRQISFNFADAKDVQVFPIAAAAAAQKDSLADRLVAAGLVPNDFILELNRGVTNPHPVPLPSRLYRFPIEFVPRRCTSESDLPDERRLLLRHPGLADFPFVREVAEKIGFAPAWEPKDRFGRARKEGSWWHAIDLMTDAHWPKLFETAHLTDRPSMLRSVELHLMTGSLSLSSARKVLAELRAKEPLDRSRALLMGDGISPAFISGEGSSKGSTQGWSINAKANGAAGAWMALHGIEDGWFGGKPSYWKLSPEGVSRRGLTETLSNAPRGKPVRR